MISVFFVISAALAQSPLCFCCIEKSKREHFLKPFLLYLIEERKLYGFIWNDI